MGKNTKRAKAGKVVKLADWAARRGGGTTLEALETRVRVEVEKVMKTPASFGDFETRLHETFMAAEREVLAKTMKELDENVAVVAVDGVRHVRASESPGRYMTAAGEVEVVRALFRDRSDPYARAVPALDAKLGIIEGFWTPGAARLAGWVVSQMTPQSAAELFARTGNMAPSKSSLTRLPKLLSEGWESDARLESALTKAVKVPDGAVTLAVSIDGVMAPMEGTKPVEKRAATAARGRIAKGPAGYRELGCATLSFCDAKGEMLSAIRMGKSPEPHKAGLKTLVKKYLAQIFATTTTPLTVVSVADAGGDNFSFVREMFPKAPEILDFFHAAEHLSSALADVFGDGTLEARERFAAYRWKLLEDPDGVEKVIGSLRQLVRQHPTKKKLAQELGYFRRNKARMTYFAWREQGLPIGSGVVEAACKTLVSQRLKLSGMRWSDEGAQAILRLRGWQQSDLFDQAWALLAATFRSEVTHVTTLRPLESRQLRG